MIVTCVACGAKVEDCSYIKLWPDTDSKAHCNPCAVKVWDCPVRFVFHPGIPKALSDSLLTHDMLTDLNRWFKYGETRWRDLPVHFFHRRQSEALEWVEVWDRYRAMTAYAPYGYRATCAHTHVVMLWDETETIESIQWILRHELAHAVCTKAHMFDYAMNQENKNEGRSGYEWRDDIGHEADSEEQLVNRIATAYTEGKERARPWWRPRVTAFQRGYTVLPDAFAAPDSPEFLVQCMADDELWASPLPIKGVDVGLVRKTVARFKGQWPGEDVRKSPGFRAALEQLVGPSAVVPSPGAATLGDPEE